jgi:pimeloyl-ACP methyl ester carboxylesterase
VVCTEDLPYVTDAASLGLGTTYLGTSIVEGLRTICARWPVGALDEGFKTPVQSAQPVLLLSGEFDPITPPAYAERVMADGLTNAVHVVGRGQGHGLIPIGCVPRILRSFLETAKPAELDTSCLAAEPPTPFFLSLLGPAP